MSELMNAEMSQVCGGRTALEQFGYDLGRWVASWFC